MIDIVILRPCPAETGGGQWRAGLTYPASDAYARALIGRGDAYDPTGNVVDVRDPAATSSTSSGGGADWTLVTEEAYGDGVRVDTYKDDSGIVWTREYNPDGSLYTETALAANLLRTWSYTAGGLGYVSGAVRKSGGAYRVNSADMAALKTELTTLGAAVVAPRFYVQDFSNGVANSGLEVEWDSGSAAFRGVGGAEIKAADWFGTANYNAFPAESGDLVTLTFPGWLASPRTEFELQMFATDTNGSTPWMNAYMGGQLMGSSGETANSQQTGEYRVRWWNNNSLASQLRVMSTGVAGTASTAGSFGSAWGASNTSYADPAVNTGATSVSVTIRIIAGTAAPGLDIRRAALLLRN